MPCQGVWFHWLSLPMRDLKALADSEVMDWQHVRTSQIEDEEHFDGPPPNPFDRSQPGHDLIVREAVAFVQRGNRPVAGLLCQFQYVAGLWSRQPSGSQSFRRKIEHFGGAREIPSAEKCHKTGENRACCPPAQLLMDNGVDKGFERRQPARSVSDRANAFNHASHVWVGTEVGYRALAHPICRDPFRPHGVVMIWLFGQTGGACLARSLNKADRNARPTRGCPWRFFHTSVSAGNRARRS